jgi:CxxC-x17-CxxC domain-containing protein
MKNFNQSGGFDDRGSRRDGGFNRRGSSDRGSSRSGGGGGRDFGRPTMHKAVCAECGADCEVPFKPTGDKPVFCSNCFRGKEGAAPRRPEGRNSSRPESRGNDNDSSQNFGALSVKLDKILSAIEALRPKVTESKVENKKEKIEKIEKPVVAK